MSKLKQKIKTGLNKDAAALIESLSSQASDTALLETSIKSLSEYYEEQKHLTDDRKKRSRQIGAARKQQQDPAELIAEVSAISEKLKAIETEIDLEVARVEENIDSGKSSADVVTVQPRIPAHLSMVDEKLDCDVSDLRFAHSDEIETSEWQSFVASQPQASVYHDARWCALIKSNFGHKPQYITCKKPNGDLFGVFPTVHLSSKLFGTFLVSMPYFNYGGPLSEYPVVAEKMMEYATQIGSNLGCTHLESRETQKRASWLCKQHKVTMILPLPESDEELDKQLGTKVRAQVKRAAREDLEYSIGGAELLSEFYRVFSHNMRDLGTPVYSKKFFLSILKSFREQASLAIVKHQGRPVAAGFLLGYKDKLEIPWASSLKSANPLGANMFMYRQILRTAIEQNYEFFDFGRSSIDASTYKFKKQWGATEHPLYWHYWLRDSGELPELNPNNPKYKLVIGLWQRLPVSVANVIGPMLVKNLP